MCGKVKLGLLVGGNSAEREVSRASAENISSCLDSNKYEVIRCEVPEDFNAGWIKQLAQLKPDIVLSALHGGSGEDGSVQGLLKCMGIPFVGSGVEASAVCMDKSLCKTIMKSACIPVIDGILIKKGSNISAYEETMCRIGFPLIVKPNRGGSSLGITVAEDMEQLKAAVKLVFDEFTDDALVEKYIFGKEVTCAVLQGEKGPEVISVLDINRKRGIFDYEAKYVDKDWSGGISNLPGYMQDTIIGIAKKTFSLLGCEGYACVDMILMDEQVYVIEVNTLPGMTAKSLIPNAVKALGMDLGSFLDRLIEYKLR